tara:strand:+ start:133 stop:450 length:318 start_codon:yes stop_codon:yes gene_type:complete
MKRPRVNTVKRHFTLGKIGAVEKNLCLGRKRTGLGLSRARADKSFVISTILQGSEMASKEYFQVKVSLRSSFSLKKCFRGLNNLTCDEKIQSFSKLLSDEMLFFS